MAISENVRDARIRAGMTQEQLAERVGVSHVWIGKIENGYRVPNAILAVKIAEALRVSVYDLVKGESGA